MVAFLGVPLSTRCTITTATSPPASGPPLHIHHDADEVFVIHAGRHLFQLEDEQFEKGPGETVFVPRGKAHTFQILGTETARCANAF